MQSDFQIPWSNVAAFVRQHMHDLRNHLNGVNLETMLLTEFVTDPDALESVERIKDQVQRSVAEMSALSAKLSQPVPSQESLHARIAFLLWQDEAKAVKNLPNVGWENAGGEANILIDSSDLSRVLREFLFNAVKFGSLEISNSVRIDGEFLVFHQAEKKKEPVAPENWGVMPFQSSKRGSYGLGIWHARQVVAVNSGTLSFRYEAEKQELVTELRFPITHFGKIDDFDA